ncbi:uncharacterized protein LOC131482344 [Ochotona princeps]|uniref:uncharacterized protein LOC131482344 n=1 Tax=Ochotona princeps TaxID=9978 RepID=UPI0027145A6B|nr:uncharacterized protein LOC131482344 [Ochotona princeps]
MYQVPTTVLNTSPITINSTMNTSAVPNTVPTAVPTTLRETYSSSTMSSHSGIGKRIKATFLCCGEGPFATSFSPDLAHTKSRTQRPSLKPAGSSDAREAITGPGTVRGPERGNLSVRCRYDGGWETFNKYWCRGAEWSSCKTLIRTTGSEQEVRWGRVSIRDHHRSCTFTVTMEQLRGDDADTYWCGMEKVGADPAVPVKVIVYSGKNNSQVPRDHQADCGDFRHHLLFLYPKSVVTGMNVRMRAKTHGPTVAVRLDQ